MTTAAAAAATATTTATATVVATTTTMTVIAVVIAAATTTTTIERSAHRVWRRGWASRPTARRRQPPLAPGAISGLGRRTPARTVIGSMDARRSSRATVRVNYAGRCTPIDSVWRHSIGARRCTLVVRAQTSRGV